MDKWILDTKIQETWKMNKKSGQMEMLKREILKQGNIKIEKSTMKVENKRRIK